MQTKYMMMLMHWINSGVMILIIIGIYNGIKEIFIYPYGCFNAKFYWL